MQNEHQSLSSQLYKTYVIILLVGLLTLLGLTLFFNRIPNQTTTLYPHHKVSPNHMLSLIMTQLQHTAHGIALVIQTHLSVINKSSTTTPQGTNFFCNSSISYSDCQAIENTSSNRKAIRQKQKTSTSFRCLDGDCVEMVSLFDYFWTFKIRYNFIDYIRISYQKSNAASTLLVPSLAVQTISVYPNVTSDVWQEISHDGLLGMGRLYNGNVYNVTILLVLDNSVLMQQYGINVKGLDLSVDPNSVLRTQDGERLLNIVYNGIILGVLIMVSLLILGRVKLIVQQEQMANFGNLEVLDSLYRYQLNSIFQGKSPRNSTVLSETSLSDFYQELSEIMDSSYSSLAAQQLPPEKEEPFRFKQLLQRTKNKYAIKTKQQQEIRKQISDFKYQLKGAVSEVTESVSKKLKQNFLKVKELHLTKAFFYHAYLCLLQQIPKFEERLQDEATALPEVLLSLLRYMNHTIHSDDIEFAFKLTSFNLDLKNELIMKIQFTLHQKYLFTVKELDIGHTYCRQLGLEKQIRYLQESIDNKKYIFLTYLK